MLLKPILLTRAQIDAQTWDNQIHQSQQCVIYALSWYLDIVCEQWEALVWPSASDFSMVMPLPVRRKFGSRVLYQPLFCQYLGIFSKNNISTEQCGAFMEALAGRFAYVSCYSLNPENFTAIHSIGHRLSGFKWEVFQTHWLDLQRPYRALLAGYSKDRKLNLKRGARMHWKITRSEDLEPLIALFEENHARCIGRIKANAYPTLRRLGEKCIQNGNGRLMYARTGAYVHAGIMLVHYRGRTIYLFNAADDAGRKGNARAVMLDRYFQANAGSESVFDFESPSKQSIAGYYSVFGAVAMPVYSIRRNALPFPLRQIQQFRKWLLIKTRQYPF
ncbi:Acetyltransferase (GNAT) domain-containing protein [Dyadobacter soli]|uniref:Acetyltransferase (GNAT) domain-containing protein n=1 Tax=Dyadobacter soli TaxID=659014 RepID=A0A1G7DT92_9BACT|nr:GNAT family N-acetyltransferase [Dyadobacter soli]SDE54727.1 Acetyltransferase (GNAT) domain-containing protein [Dyadobacter soli]